MNQEDYKHELDRWLKSISLEATERVCQVVFTLDFEWQLRDHNNFNVPLDKLIKVESISKDDVLAVLTNLQSKNILLVMRYLGEWPESDDPDDPVGQRWGTIEHNPDIVNYEDTQIHIVFPDHFRYLVKKLKEIRVGNIPNAQIKEISKIAWDDKFQWDHKKFIFGNYGFVEFKSQERKALFGKLTMAKGNWVKITELRGSKNYNYIRATVSQIEKKFGEKLKKYISIPSTQDDEAPGKPPGQGAYRIKFTP